VTEQVGPRTAGKNRLYVVLGMFATGLMATPVFGTINVGLLFGLAQFPSTFAITGLYVRFTIRMSVLAAAEQIGDPVSTSRSSPPSSSSRSRSCCLVRIDWTVVRLRGKGLRRTDPKAPLSAHFRYRPGPSSCSANVAGSR
jgi:hypothetical protein